MFLLSGNAALNHLSSLYLLMISNPCFKWSGGRDLNPRPSAWKAETLPLSYPRSITATSAEKQHWIYKVIDYGIEPLTSSLPRTRSTS